MATLTGAPFQLRRVNPFQGLMIDAGVWRDAHEYHRDQMRLHHLLLHGWGIIRGLDVSVVGDDNTVLIEEGVGIDPQGNFIIAAQQHRYRVETRLPGTVYLVIQFRDVLTGPNQPSGDGAGTPTRILEAYRIQERDRLPAEPYLELARIEFDPARGPINAPSDPLQPGLNELDLRHRTDVWINSAIQSVLPTLPSMSMSDESAPPPPVSARPISEPTPAEMAPLSPTSLQLGLAVHQGSGWDRHRDGLRYLSREVEAAIGLPARLADKVIPAEADGVDLLYLSGDAGLRLEDADVAGIARLVDRGGVVIGEGCGSGPQGDGGARQFALSFNELANQLGRRLSKVERGHQLFVARHVFAMPPAGSSSRANALLLEDRGMSYSDADYGCAWQGGAPGKSLERSVIRDALELGVNLTLYRRDVR